MATSVPVKYLDEDGLVHLVKRISRTFYQLPNEGIPQGDLSVEVQTILNKADAIDVVTTESDGLMTAEDKRKLDAIGIHFRSTEYWNSLRDFVPKAGEIIIYSDYSTKVVDGTTYPVPAMKIGTGNAYLQDLMFMAGGDSREVMEHMADKIIHVSAEERAFWNNKLNVTEEEVINEVLIFNRQ